MRFILIICLLFASRAHAQNQLLIRDNTPIDYSKIDENAIRSAVADMKKSVDAQVEAIITNSKGSAQGDILKAYDQILYELGDLSSRIGLVSSVFNNESVRNAGYAAANELQMYANDLNLNEDLYKAFVKFRQSPDAKRMNASAGKFLSDIMISFEKNGMKLTADERKKLSALNTRMIELSTAFDQNIASWKDSVIFTEAQLKGVHAEDLAKWKQPDGSFKVMVNYPEYAKVMENASVPETRKKMYTHYNNRAYPSNLQVLDSLLYYRDQYAKLLGYSSYAAYAVADKMAGSAQQVWDFENDLIQRLTPLVTKEVKAMKDFRDKTEPSLKGTELNAWDWGYFTKKMLNTEFALNTDEVTQYFEMNNTLKGMFTVYQQLFNIEVKETSNVPVWDKKVKSYDMYKDGVKTGTFYLDLYPRPGKYTHFACFPISQYINRNGTETLPVAALVCNFPEGSADQPSLLKHSDVITLFHEFGHLVHWELCHPAISAQHSFGVKGDFVEAPSQFLENWCWEYDALKIFARHHKTGEVLPESLFNKMKNAQMFNSASQNMRQVYLGTTDFSFEDRYAEVKQKGLMQIARSQFANSQLPYPEGTHFICSFTHLSQYGANYYGYLWSKVYAQDMFSVFKKTGIMDQKLGIRYRKEILEKGSTENEKQIVENFLGRKPNSAAFLETLGVKQQ
jgi:thimet oligopeptidase